MPTPLRLFVLYLVVYLLTVVAPSHAEQLTEFFQITEFRDQYTGENKIDKDFVQKLNSLREACGFPFIINSGYRSKNHPVEILKRAPGTHTDGIAADIRIIDGYQRRKIVEEALKLGFRGIGIHKHFVHVDMRKGPPVIWVY